MKSIAFAVSMLFTAACVDEGPVPFIDSDGGFPTDGSAAKGGTGGKGGSGGMGGSFGGTGGSGGGTGGSTGSCPTSWSFYSASCDSCMRGQCCSILQACDMGSACRQVDDCRFASCVNAADLMTCMQQYCNSSGFTVWQQYWSCMQSNCSSPCAS